MDTLDAGDADKRAAAEASLFETDADSDTSEGTASPTPQPAQLSTLSPRTEAPADTLGKASAFTEAGSELPRSSLDALHLFPSTLSSDSVSPAATSPPHTPGTPSHRPRPRTRTRTRGQSRMHAHPSTSSDPMGAPSLGVHNASAANALANLLAHSPALAPVPPTPLPAAREEEPQTLDELSLDFVPALSPANSNGSQGERSKAHPSSTAEDFGSTLSTTTTSLSKESDAPRPASLITDCASTAAALAQGEEPESEGGRAVVGSNEYSKDLPRHSPHFSKHLTLQPAAGGRNHEDWEFWGTVISGKFTKISRACLGLEKLTYLLLGQTMEEWRGSNPMCYPGQSERGFHPRCAVPCGS